MMPKLPPIPQLPPVPKLPPLPPVTAEYTSAVKLPQPNVPPVQSSYRFTRATSGQTRTDSGNTSVISNPAAGQTIMLDHVKKTATIQTAPPPMPAAPGMPAMPQFAPPGLPKPPQAPNIQMQDLGKSVLQGYEVEGKKLLVPPQTPPPPTMPKPPGLQLPGAPKLPQAPALPKLPQVPGMPKLPQPPAPPQTLQAPKVPGGPPVPTPPGMPQPPKPPTIAEVWTAPKIGLPMLTKASGSFGQLTQVCQKAIPGEPNPAAFQIPPGYKVIVLPPPKPPALTLPKPPALTPPKPPALPKL